MALSARQRHKRLDVVASLGSDGSPSIADSPASPASITGLEGARLLGTFLCGTDECCVVALEAGGVRTRETQWLPSWTEVCRFQVNGALCAVVRRTADESGDGELLADLLSARELQIATLVALGHPNKQVARRLHISEWTVGTYLRRIYAKLGVDSRAAMTYRCASLIRCQVAGGGSESPRGSGLPNQ